MNSAQSEQIDRFEAEQRAQKKLAARGLFPRSRLLLVGPPGCGKTLCTEVLCSDLNLPLIYSRIDGIVSSYLGETATNLRRVFTFASQQRGVLFFDEFDAIGKRRGDSQEIGELKRVVSSFLQILDSHPREGIVVAATNHEGLLDEALWRRFDDVVYFPRPTHEQLVRLLELRLRGTRKRQADLSGLAKEMDGFTYADAERVCVEAIKSMCLESREELTQDLLLAALAEHKARVRLASGGSDQGERVNG